MSERNFKKELNYYTYNDPEYGEDIEDIEHIDYDCLIGIITELVDRIEKLEKSQHTHSEMNND